MPSSMHRHDAFASEAPSPITNKPLVRPLNVVVGRALTESLVGQIGSSLKERIGNVLIHGRMVRAVFVFLNSHFPTLIKRADTVAALQKNFPSFCSGK